MDESATLNWGAAHLFAWREMLVLEQDAALIPRSEGKSLDEAFDEVTFLRVEQALIGEYSQFFANMGEKSEQVEAAVFGYARDRWNSLLWFLVHEEGMPEDFIAQEGEPIANRFFSDFRMVKNSPLTKALEELTITAGLHIDDETLIGDGGITSFKRGAALKWRIILIVGFTMLMLFVWALLDTYVMQHCTANHEPQWYNVMIQVLGSAADGLARTMGENIPKGMAGAVTDAVVNSKAKLTCDAGSAAYNAAGLKFLISDGRFLTAVGMWSIGVGSSMFTNLQLWYYGGWGARPFREKRDRGKVRRFTKKEESKSERQFLLTDACVVCASPAIHVCGGCNDATYCSEFCQEQDWLGEHANSCQADESHH